MLIMVLGCVEHARLFPLGCKHPILRYLRKAIITLPNTETLPLDTLVNPKARELGP